MPGLGLKKGRNNIHQQQKSRSEPFNLSEWGKTKRAGRPLVAQAFAADLGSLGIKPTGDAEGLFGSNLSHGFDYELCRTSQEVCPVFINIDQIVFGKPICVSFC